MQSDRGVKLEDRSGVGLRQLAAMPFDTECMYRGWVNTDGTRGTAIFKDDVK